MPNDEWQVNGDAHDRPTVNNCCFCVTNPLARRSLQFRGLLGQHFILPNSAIAVKGYVHCTAVLPFSVWPHLFCGAGHEKRRGEQLKWSLVFRLCIGIFPCAVYQDQFIQPDWAECFLYMFSLGLCFVCSFVFFDLFLCPHSCMFP